LTLNLHRVFTLTQKCLPLLRAAANEGGKESGIYLDPARIINVRHFPPRISKQLIRLVYGSQIGSVEGIDVPDHETYAYSASKAGLHHLSRTLGGRLGWDGITSNTIACGQCASIFPYPLTLFLHKRDRC
jgi:NAD(P)-dependent dehydrogenase (short-subunit alcohol dehydrogenase family)